MDKLEGFTPLMDAKKNKHMDVVALLEAAGGVTIDNNLGYKLCDIGFKGDVEALKE